jgi:two-component sensor histidine kinase
MRLTVADDGVGLPATLDLANATSLGLVLVQALTEQLGGHLQFVGPPGTTVHVTFQPGFE